MSGFTILDFIRETRLTGGRSSGSCGGIAASIEGVVFTEEGGVPALSCCDGEEEVEAGSLGEDSFWSMNIGCSIEKVGCRVKKLICGGVCWFPDDTGDTPSV